MLRMGNLAANAYLIVLVNNWLGCATGLRFRNPNLMNLYVEDGRCRRFKSGAVLGIYPALGSEPPHRAVRFLGSTSGAAERQ
jgi:hypothetical protein